MDVPGALNCRIQCGRWQQEAISRDDQCVGACRSQALDIFGKQALWLMQRQSTNQGELLYGAGNRSQAAARGPVGLRQDERDFMASIGQTYERNRGELGRAGED